MHSPPIDLEFVRKKKALINVGGIRHEILWKSLQNYPNSRLGKLYLFESSCEEIENLCDDVCIEKNEFFFDRDPNLFLPILNLYRTGKLHFLENTCALAFYDELVYWGIDESLLELCCHLKYDKLKQNIMDQISKQESKNEQAEKVIQNNSFFSKLSHKIWKNIENPQNSKFGKLWSILSIFFIILASLSLILETVPDLQIKNLTNNSVGYTTYKYTVNPIFDILEAICISWFSLEYLTRFICSPRKLVFLRGFLNLIDLISIIPYFICHIFIDEKLHQLNNVRRLLIILRILRIIRVLKLARHSTGLRSLGLTLKKSRKELALLFLFLSIVVVIYSSLVFFFEKDVPDTQFNSIPNAFWWALITMTTVGYGDMVPTTLAGKIIGSLCCLSGILVIALPIPVIVNNFTEHYEEQSRMEKLIIFKKNKKSFFKMNSKDNLETIVPLVDNDQK
ncbi:unnamed protein product [Brachionus calyciflorus]|uniref:BTB domain-containing protein n=1 Tax=Brachionus calyciflorus TaxID=104777 RepID=A0A813VG52_9BILA|nr:unnamed protein product [Brachionus calyciflorus]